MQTRHETVTICIMLLSRKGYTGEVLTVCLFSGDSRHSVCGRFVFFFL